MSRSIQSAPACAAGARRCFLGLDPTSAAASVALGSRPCALFRMASKSVIAEVLRRNRATSMPSVNRRGGWRGMCRGNDACVSLLRRATSAHTTQTHYADVPQPLADFLQALAQRRLFTFLLTTSVKHAHRVASRLKNIAVLLLERLHPDCFLLLSPACWRQAGFDNHAHCWRQAGFDNHAPGLLRPAPRLR